MNEAVHVRQLLESLGVDLEDPSFKETPDRFIKVLHELIGNGANDPPPVLKTFPVTASGQIVFSGHMKAATLCPHHLLPFLVEGYFAYKPTNAVVGISKPSRLLQYVCKGWVLQEAAGPRFLELFSEQVVNRGAIILLRGYHLCTAVRGAKQSDNITVTMDYSKEFEAWELRREFFELINLSKGDFKWL